MEIKRFCRGSKRLAIKYYYYLKYKLLIALCIVAPIVLLALDYFGVFKSAGIRKSSFLVVILFLIWLVILLIGYKGSSSVTALRYQIFGITDDNRLVHFWFKELLRDGKVVLRFRPYRKKDKHDEFTKIAKKKEDIIKDEHFEEYLINLCKDTEIQKKSDILFEVMEDTKIIKDRRKYIVVTYVIGNLKTKKKLKIYKNVIHLDEMMKLMIRE